MADSRQRRFQLWPWRQRTATVPPTTAPPTAQELSQKLTELVHFERGVAALYYYLPDETLANVAQTLCQSYQAANIIDQGVERDLRDKDPALEPWRAVSVIWHSTVWEPAEILATFGFRIIEALRARHEIWSVVVDPRAQFFGLAVTQDGTHRYWLVLVIGQRGREMESDPATAAR